MTGESGVDWGFLLAMAISGGVVALLILLTWLSLKLEDRI